MKFKTTYFLVMMCFKISYDKLCFASILLIEVLFLHLEIQELTNRWQET